MISPSRAFGALWERTVSERVVSWQLLVVARSEDTSRLTLFCCFPQTIACFCHLSGLSRQLSVISRQRLPFRPTFIYRRLSALPESLPWPDYSAPGQNRVLTVRLPGTVRLPRPFFLFEQGPCQYCCGFRMSQ
jgi:hypothetical protein